MKIIKNIVGGNVSELALYPGDDGSGSTISLPVSGESNVQDYVTIRSTNAGVHHAFSTSGNYYCAENIVVTGTITANAFNAATGAIGTILNGNLNTVSSVTSGSAYRLGYINVTAGTWIVSSQLQVYGTGTAGTYMHVSNCLSLVDGAVNGDNMTSTGSQMPYGSQTQTTWYYKAVSTTTIYFNISISFSSGSISIVQSGCYLKAIRISWCFHSG